MAKMSNKQRIQINFTRLPELTNECYYPLYWNESRYLVLYGGAGSGKSVFTAQKIVYRMVSETGHRFLVVRKVAKTIRNSVFAEIKGVISDWGLTELFDENKSAMEITCVNGNIIIFCGLDDVEKLKSIKGITSVWIEEASEVEQSDFQQINLRLRGVTRNYKQIVISFNPVIITHWLKTYFFDDEKEGTFTLKTTYRDNRFIDPEYAKVIEALKDIDPYYYMVYGLGEWGVVGGIVYNAKIVTERLLVVREQMPLLRGNFVYEYKNEQIVEDSIRLIRDDKGFICIYEEPEPYTPYVVGGDIAEGGVEFSAASVRNNLTWNQAAVFRGHLDTDLYAKQMFCLGRYYNKALIGIETNFDSHPVKELARLNYSKQYVQERLDKFTKELVKKFGWQTSKITRPLIIARHVELHRDHIYTFNDKNLLEEMLTFVRDETGRPEHQEGKTDDVILADAICLGIREQQTMKELPGKQKEELPFPLAYKEQMAKLQQNRAKRGRLM